MTVSVELMRNGGYLVSDIINGQWENRRYFFYTKREAVALFKDEFYPKVKL